MPLDRIGGQGTWPARSRAIPHGFSDEEADHIESLAHGDQYVEAALQAVRSADAVLFLISPWTLQSKFQADELSAGLNSRRVVPCIVHEDVAFDQLPADLRKLFVAKVTEQSLSTKEGKARLRKLIDDVSLAAITKREPTKNTRPRGRHSFESREGR